MMRVTLLGTRGSMPAPGRATAHYGGNTPSVAVCSSDGTRLILDAGTGICRLVGEIPDDTTRIDILLTHLHMDHIQGLGFFGPLYHPGIAIHIWGWESDMLEVKVGEAIEVSWVGIWILAFPAIVTLDPGRVLRTSLLSALTLPAVGLVSLLVHGVPENAVGFTEREAVLVILRVTIPKAEGARPREIPVKAGETGSRQVSAGTRNKEKDREAHRTPQSAS